MDSWGLNTHAKDPKICPVLALDKYFFSRPEILSTDSKLFPGNHQYEISLKIFHRIINNNIEEFHSLGVEKGTLGSHYFRKVAITIVASGTMLQQSIKQIEAMGGETVQPLATIVIATFLK